MDLKDAIAYNQNRFLTLDQVVGIGRGYKEIGGERTEEESIQILVCKKKPKSELSQKDIVPEVIDGYTTDVIEVGHLKVQSLRTSRVRPAQPGMSIGHYQVSAGTFGAVVYDLATGQPLILSNNHVLANTSSTDQVRARIGDPILQPGSYDGGEVEKDVIGYLERYIPIKLSRSEQVGVVARGISRLMTGVGRLLSPRQGHRAHYQVKMMRYGGENLVDCAVAVPVNEEWISDKILEIGYVKGVSRAYLGEMVQKSGRTSGYTKGRVRTLDATVTVEMGNGEDAIFTDQIIIDAISQGGDSGSLVLNKNNQAIGLLFAGSVESTICNPIISVLNALKVRF